MQLNKLLVKKLVIISLAIMLLSLIGYGMFIFFRTDKAAPSDSAVSSNSSANSTHGEDGATKMEDIPPTPITPYTRAITRVSPLLEVKGRPAFTVISTEEPTPGWAVLVIVSHEDTGPTFQTAILKSEGKNWLVAAPIYATDIGEEAAQYYDVPQEVRDVMISDAAKYHEGVIL